MPNNLKKEKRCPDCKKIHSVTSFSKNRARHDGLQSVCKSCLKIRGVKWRHQKNPPKESLIIDDLHKKCISCENVFHIDFFHKQKNGHLGKKARCKNCESERYKKWRLEQGGKSYENQWNKDKKNSDPLFKLKYITRLRVNEVLKKHKVTKRHSGLKLLGCTIEEYKKHLESKFYVDPQTNQMMTWKNHGKIWEVDHIIPLASAKNKETLFSLFHYTNTQPLTIRENRSKRDSII